MQPAAIQPALRNDLFRRVSLLLVPSLSDCLFLALLIWMFAAGNGWFALLADGDTGWHIRAGELILDTGTVPTRDPFSFSKAGEPWFAWEWLADVVFALFDRRWGLKGVVAFTGLVLSLTATLLYRHMVWRGANVLVALVATLVAAGAATVHYLARPHIFTLVGMVVCLWLLDRDRRSPTRAVWWLVPISALWTNLHGGFLAWIACLALVAVASGVRALWFPPFSENRFGALGRYAGLALACSLATLLNPYGYQLHLHITRYLGSDWIRQVVDEFQSPKFRSESMLHFEILLFAGLGFVPVLFRKRSLAEILLVLFWAHAALLSARHVPVYALVAAPICAAEASLLWARWAGGRARRSWAGILRDCVDDFSVHPQRTSLWIPVILAGLAGLPLNWPKDFPYNKFPVAAVSRNADRLAPERGEMPRILTSDQWGDYLIYRLYPRQRVFVDGRSDFYGPTVGRRYLELMNATHHWESIVDQYRFDLALLPVDWPLVELLKRHPRWRVRYDDGQAILLERPDPSALNPPPDSAEGLHRGPSQ